MLRSLHIRHFAIIDEVQLEFGPGLNILSGETGAGKSIIIQALSLLMGMRGSSDWIRKGEESASVHGLFDIAQEESVQALLKEWDVPCEDGDLLIQRKLSAQGRSQVRLNGMPATVNLLSQLSEYLVDIVSQKEHEMLLRPEIQRTLLDRYGQLEEARATYQETLRALNQNQEQLTKLQEGDQANREMEEFLRFQVKEIADAELKSDEAEELKAEKARIKHASKLGEFCTWTEQALSSGEETVSHQLSQIETRLLKVSDLDPELEKMMESLQGAQAQLDEFSRAVNAYLSELQFEPGRLESLESRLAELDRLKRKYGLSVDAILQYAEDTQSKLNGLENFDEEVARLEELIQQQGRQLVQQDKKLQTVRKKVGEQLSKAVMTELKDLNMKQAVFSVQWEPVTTGLVNYKNTFFDSLGSHRGVFYLMSNPGEDPQPLARIASGGERSRILLALKKVLSEFAAVNVAVFDEVDEGVGGATSSKIGEKLAQIAAQRQVLCITHQPQIAAFAHTHFVISKEFEQKRTQTLVRMLQETEREEEIARMLAGAEVTTKARDHARELIAGVGT